MSKAARALAASRLPSHVRARMRTNANASATLANATLATANVRERANMRQARGIINLDVEPLQPPNSRHSLCAGHQTGSDWRPGGVDFSGLCTTMVRGAVGRLFVGLGPLLARTRGRGVPQGLSWCGARPPPRGGCLRRRGGGRGGEAPAPGAARAAPRGAERARPPRC